MTITGMSHGRSYSSMWSRLITRSMTGLTLPSTLRLIRDNGNTLYNRINTEGYQESEDDIQAVSGIAEDIRDALLDYQVCDNYYSHNVWDPKIRTL